MRGEGGLIERAMQANMGPTALEVDYHITRGEGPLVAVALHSGHERSAEMAGLQTVDTRTRRREEDPYVDRLTEVAPNTVVVARSRFDVDFNRSREKCVYLAPEDAWGIRVWASAPPAELVETARAAHDRFYGDVRDLLDGLVARYGRFVVLDLHSYCHRRSGPTAAPDDPALNPELNIGSLSVDTGSFGPLVGRFVSDLRRFDYDGRPLDVRENVRFGGGFFPRWVNTEYAGRGCAITVEVKKFFMDEWTGALDEEQLSVVKDALASTVPALLSWLGVPR